jgi:hypothetical protein
VLTNPPFGKKSSIKVINEEGEESKEKAIYYLEDSANLADPDIIATEIAEDLEAALEQFSQIANDLK